eukprot:11960673-Ditylum_brightwellii.AAC.1
MEKNKFTNKFHNPNGCYYCWSAEHPYLQCPCLNGTKKKTKEGYDVEHGGVAAQQGAGVPLPAQHLAQAAGSNVGNAAVAAVVELKSSSQDTNSTNDSTTSYSSAPKRPSTQLTSLLTIEMARILIYAASKQFARTDQDIKTIIKMILDS